MNVSVTRDPRFTLLLRFRAGAAVIVLGLGVLEWLRALGDNRTALVLLIAGVAIAASNLAASRVLTGEGARMRAGVLVLLDALILTFALAGWGGATNPFVNLYLVQIALAAALLGPRWSWGMAAGCTALYAFLFNVSPEHDAAMHAFSEHLRGMWTAFVLCALLVAAFASRLARLAETQAAELRIAEDKRLRAQHLALVSAFAADAVHELSTPLTTLTVVAGELERNAALGRKLDASDLQLLQQEVDRCGRILSAISARSVGERANDSPTSLREVVETCAEKLSLEERARLTRDVPEGLSVTTPREAVERALLNLLRNALEADPRERVFVSGRSDAEGVTLLVEDRGPGLHGEAAARAGEPFFSTKKNAGGLGMGLFAARSLVAPFGGDIALEPRTGGGARARLFLPFAS